MSILLQPLLVVLLSACVFGIEDESRTKQLKALFCESTNEELRGAIEKCFDDNIIDDNEKLKEVTEKCYPGMEFPITGENARKWHCSSSDEIVEKGDKCMDEVFDDLSEDSEALDVVVGLWECMMDAYNEHIGENGN